MLMNKISAVTHQGPYLNLNEDGHFIDIKNKICMILDGFGGSGIGDQCVKKVIENMKSYLGKTHYSSDVTLPYYFAQRHSLCGNILINALLGVHKLIYDENLSRDYSKRGGCSVIVSQIDNNVMNVLSVGNCICYLYSYGKLDKVIAQNSMKFFGNRNGDSKLAYVPLDALGLYEELGFELREIKIKKNDLIIMMTDGVYGKISDSILKYVLGETSLNLQQKIDHLFSKANENGNYDNQTAIFMQF